MLQFYVPSYTIKLISSRIMSNFIHNYWTRKIMTTAIAVLRQNFEHFNILLPAKQMKLSKDFVRFLQYVSLKCHSWHRLVKILLRLNDKKEVKHNEFINYNFNFIYVNFSFLWKLINICCLLIVKTFLNCVFSSLIFLLIESTALSCCLPLTYF